MDERYETLIANLTAIAAGQQILIDRLLRGSSELDADGDVQRIAQDARVLLAATRLFLRAGPPESSDEEGEEDQAARKE